MTNSDDRVRDLSVAFAKMGEGFNGSEFLEAMAIAAGCFIREAPQDHWQSLFDIFCGNVEAAIWLEGEDGNEVCPDL